MADEHRRGGLAGAGWLHGQRGRPPGGGPSGGTAEGPAEGPAPPAGRALRLRRRALVALVRRPFLGRGAGEQRRGRLQLEAQLVPVRGVLDHRLADLVAALQVHCAGGRLTRRIPPALKPTPHIQFLDSNFHMLDIKHLNVVAIWLLRS